MCVIGFVMTGYVALKQLGFKIECYVASEVHQDSINVGEIKHCGQIKHVGDVCNITSEQVSTLSSNRNRHISTFYVLP